MSSQFSPGQQCASCAFMEMRNASIVEVKESTWGHVDFVVSERPPMDLLSSI